MRYLSEIFWRHSQDVCSLVPNNYKFLVCLSVCQLAYFLTEIRQIQGYLKFWMRYLSEIFWRHFWDVGTLFPNNQKFLLCLSVHQLAYIHTDIRPIQGNLLFWMRYLSEIFWRHSLDVLTQFPYNQKLFVCPSVCQLPYFLTEIRQMQRYLLFWMRYLPEIFLRHSCDIFTLFPNNS